MEGKHCNETIEPSSSVSSSAAVVVEKEMQSAIKNVDIKYESNDDDMDEKTKLIFKKYFGSTISLLTNQSWNIPYQPFPSKLKEAISSHISKAKENRHTALKAIEINTNNANKQKQASGEIANPNDEMEGELQQLQEKKSLDSHSSPLMSSSSEYEEIMTYFFEKSNLAKENEFQYDTSRYPLQKAFLTSCCLPENFDLSTVHIGGGIQQQEDDHVGEVSSNNNNYEEVKNGNDKSNNKHAENNVNNNGTTSNGEGNNSYANNDDDNNGNKNESGKTKNREHNRLISSNNNDDSTRYEKKVPMRRDETCKLNLLFNLTKNNNNSFQEIYDEFVREVCCPKLYSLYSNYNTGDAENKFGCNNSENNIIYYQSFPCIRVIQPNEFSIGPHADVAYGHHPCSINFYIPLTKIVGTSNTLFLESKPGLEDWHPIFSTTIDSEEVNNGIVKHFAGGICLHWTTNNNTQYTRVSIDFRLIPGFLYDALKDGGSSSSSGNSNGGKHDVYRAKKGYYTKCQLVNNNDGNNNSKTWERIGPLQQPDERMGFPWTVKNWDKLFKQNQSKMNKK